MSKEKSKLAPHKGRLLTTIVKPKKKLLSSSAHLSAKKRDQVIVSVGHNEMEHYRALSNQSRLFMIFTILLYIINKYQPLFVHPLQFQTLHNFHNLN